MDLPGEWLGSSWIAAGWALTVIALVAAAWRAPWFHLRNPADVSAWLAGLCITLAIWQIRAELPEGGHLHLIGAAVLTYMFGWAFALIGLAAVVAAHVLAHGQPWTTIAPAYVAVALMPVVAARIA